VGARTNGPAEWGCSGKFCNLKNHTKGGRIKIEGKRKKESKRKIGNF